MAKRTDIHRDSVLIPADYEFQFDFADSSHCGEPINWGMKEVYQTFDTGRVWAGQKDEFTCAACGTAYRYGVCYLHRPTNEFVFIGHVCAGKLALAHDDAAWRRRYADAQKRAYIRSERRKNFLKWKAEVLALPKATRLALRCSHQIVRDMIQKGLRWGSLSVRQYELVVKLYTQETTPKVEAPKLQVPTGRVVIEGRVVSVKSVQGYGYNQTTLKMLVLVERPEGEFKVFGTVPSQILDMGGTVKGCKVRFTAACQPKELGFGFFSRPTKAEVLELGPGAHTTALAELRREVKAQDDALRLAHSARGQFTSGMVNAVATEIALHVETDVRARMAQRYGEMVVAQAFQAFVEEAA